MSFCERVTTRFRPKGKDKSDRNWLLIVQKIDARGRTRVLDLACRPASTYDKAKRTLSLSNELLDFVVRQLSCASHRK